MSTTRPLLRPLSARPTANADPEWMRLLGVTSAGLAAAGLDPHEYVTSHAAQLDEALALDRLARAQRNQDLLPYAAYLPLASFGRPGSTPFVWRTADIELTTEQLILRYYGTGVVHTDPADIRIHAARIRTAKAIFLEMPGYHPLYVTFATDALRPFSSRSRDTRNLWILTRALIQAGATDCS